MNIDEAMIPIATIWDALTLYYMINISKPLKFLTLFNQQKKWLFLHLNQLTKWILILEPISEDQVFTDRLWPTAINVAWKSKHQKKQKLIIISFGASIIGSRSVKKQIINLRQQVNLENYHLFSQNANRKLKKNQAP